MERKRGRPEGQVYPNIRNIRFKAEDAEDIARLAVLWRCTEAEAVRRAVRETARREKGSGAE